jgi:hypothetical protein
MSDAKQTIVIAWAEETGLVPTGHYARKDGVNYFPEFARAWEAKAAMWLRQGSESDLAKAHEYAKRNGYSVFAYPTKEKDPLAKARKEVLASK